MSVVPDLKPTHSEQRSGDRAASIRLYLDQFLDWIGTDSPFGDITGI
jgi:hypothetical protein